MLRIILKSAWRQLRNNRAYTAVNILGLAIGLGTAILCGLWIQEQFAYNQFHADGERIFQAMQDFQPNDDVPQTYDALPLPLAAVLREETPGVAYVVEADWGMTQSLVVGEQKLLRKGNYVGRDFLRVFSFPLLRGDKENALAEPNQIVLSRQTARALFGDADPMGKEVRIGNDLVLQVSGIMEDFPSTSTLQYDYLLPFSLKVQQQAWMKEEFQNWQSYSYQLFFALEPQAKIASILAQHRNVIIEHDPEAISYFNVHALTDWHLFNTFQNGEATSGRISNVRLFGIIGMLVLLIACVNFINLTTARAEKRSKEIGVKKAIGASRGHLIIQLFGESALLVGIAGGLALLLVYGLLPYFNLFVEEAIIFPWRQPTFWLALVFLLMTTVLLAGIYPALWLTRYPAKEALEKSFQTANTAHAWGRRVLVGSQFLVAIGLIAGSLVIYQQVKYGQQLDNGYNKEMLIDIPLTDALRADFSALRERLLAQEGVQGIATSSSPMTELLSSTNSIEWPGRTADDNLEVGMIGVGEDFFATVGIKLKEGRTFKAPREMDQDALIINETAVKKMGLKAPLTTKLNWDEQAYSIIGVVEDVIMDSPFDPVLPTVYLKRNWANSLLLRLNDRQPVTRSLAAVQSITERFDATTPFSYTFVEENYARKFKSSNFIGTVALTFAVLAIFLSSLGLFGLAVYLAERRAREISIRKILGASVSQLWLLLSQEFLWIILVGGLLAVPFGGYFLEGWLDNFTYRIDMPWLTFGLAAGLALLIALLTISVQSIKAALVNPAKRLRDNG